MKIEVFTPGCTDLLEEACNSKEDDIKVLVKKVVIAVDDSRTQCSVKTLGNMEDV